MCVCTPEIKTPFCGKPGCAPPAQGGQERRIFRRDDEAVILTRYNSIGSQVFAKDAEGTLFVFDASEWIGLKPVVEPIQAAGVFVPVSSLRIPMPAGAIPPPCAGTKFSSRFRIGDCVHVDDDEDLVMRVTGHMWGGTDEGEQVRLAWFSSGTSHAIWFDAWRVRAVTP